MFRFLLQVTFIRRVLQFRFARLLLILVFAGAVIAGLDQAFDRRFHQFPYGGLPAALLCSSGLHLLFYHLSSQARPDNT